MKLRLAPLLATAIVWPACLSYDVLFAQTPEAIATSLARCVDDSAVAVAHVDLEQVDVASAAKSLAQMAESGGASVDLPALASLPDQVQSLKAAGVQHVYAVFAAASLGDQNPYYVAIVQPGHDPAAVAGQVKKTLSNPTGLFVLSTNRKSFAGVTAIGDAVVAGPESVIATLKQSAPAPRPELTSALAAAGSAPLALLLVPSSDQRKALEEVLPKLPPSIGGGPITVLTRGLLWGAIGYSPQRQTWDVVIQSQSPAAATALQKELRDFPGRFAQVGWMTAVFPEGHIAESLVPAVTDDQLKLTVKRSDPGALALEQALAQAGKIARSTLWNTTRRDHLKEIALAMHNFHDVYGRFPAQAIYDKNGRALLSWRVQLLPFLEEGKLYKEFHLDEPWDSEHNKQLIARIPAVFRTPELASQDRDKTTLLGPSGKRAFFQGKQGVSIREITDGTSNTIMILESRPNEAVLWTKPDDFNVDAGHLHERLFQGRESLASAFCDGSARTLPKTIEEKTLEWLLTINGGEIVPQF